MDKLTWIRISQILGLPMWLNGKESTCQYRRYGFNPCVGKISWSRKWRLTPVLFPGKFRGQRRLVGYSPQDRQESDMTEPSTHTASQILK